MKILVIYDGSDDSKAALKYGMLKVRASGSELTAMHVFRDADCSSRGESLSTAAASDSVGRPRPAGTVTNARGNPIALNVAVAAGSSVEEILQFAARHSIDLIVGPPGFEPLMEKACCLTDVVSKGTVLAEAVK